MAWVTLVWVAKTLANSRYFSNNQANPHSTVGSVSPPPGLWRLVHNNVFDDELINGQVLGIGVGLGVLQQGEDEFNRLLGPST